MRQLIMDLTCFHNDRVRSPLLAEVFSGFDDTGLAAFAGRVLNWIVEGGLGLAGPVATVEFHKPFGKNVIEAFRRHSELREVFELEEGGITFSRQLTATEIAAIVAYVSQRVAWSFHATRWISPSANAVGPNAPKRD